MPSNKYKNTKIKFIKMRFTIREYKKFNKKTYDSFLMAGDIGGTNTSLGIFGVKNNPALLVSFHFKSRELRALHDAVNEALAYSKDNYKINITKACFAVAGVLSANGDYAQITNAKWDASRKILLKKTNLKKIALINDFEAVGYGINTLAKKDVMAIKKAKPTPKAPILVIGAGTGLGKTTLVYDRHQKAYKPIPSEAGHSDFAAQSKLDFELVDFIRKRKKAKSVSYEQVLSGQGLGNIYLFLRKNKKFKAAKYTKEIDKSKSKPELISKYRKADKTCKETFEIFKIAYAGFAKNMALDGLALGGVYIAGGIAPKNREIFDKSFVKIFEESLKMGHILKRMPIYLILNYDVGLLGAGFAGSRLL